MAILVDPAIYLWRGMMWCHMVSDVDADELHAFAARLGLKREWSQERPPAGKSSAHHYDITASRRAKAIRMGAIPVTARELVMRNYDGLRRRGLLPMLDTKPGGST